ncbi:hypothetical protein [cf. Phormidesmis sp. LEGE 11477]|uniref:hypothetical protein n=1 Tax=cf. Phormidesmis sp. LEGE 11477 TaxID=1828680 RepID=UPI001880CE8B|nr:hypothetical protein [cf. Phormidesmis sp. LEGE 11477]MBE9064623.1 hypothetical protein [cf. Phormidesmis sp. LEGE 11477]
MDLINITSLLLAVISILISVYFYLKSKSVKRILYCSRSITVIEDLPQDNRLKLYFSDREIRKLILTKVAIWNSGSETIKPDSFVEKIPLRVSFAAPNKTIESYLLYANNKTNEILPKIDQAGNLLINFKYLDPGDGVVIKIAHEGKVEDFVSVEGTIYNKKKNRVKRVSKEYFIQYMRGSISYRETKKAFKYSFLPVVLLSIVLFLTILTGYAIAKANVTEGTFSLLLITAPSVLVALLYLFYAEKLYGVIEAPIFRYMQRIREPKIACEFVSENWALSEGKIVE